MEPIKAVLFDVIGTTVLENDPDLINNFFCDAFLRNGIPVEKTEILRVRGKDKRAAIEVVVKNAKGPAALSEKIFQDFTTMVKAEISNFHEHPEFSDVIGFLQNRRILIGVGSGLPTSIFRLLFDHLNWQKYRFSYAEVFEKFLLSRPDPVMITDMCMRLNIPPQNLLKVGDTEADIREGKNANAQTAIVLSGTQPSEFLINAGADHTFKSLVELLTLFH